VVFITPVDILGHMAAHWSLMATKKHIIDRVLFDSNELATFFIVISPHYTAVPI